MKSSNSPDEKVSSSRRKFITRLAQLSTLAIVPRFVLGGNGYTPPSDLVNLGFVGTGRQAHTLRNYFFEAGGSRIVAASEVYGVKADLFIEKTNAFYAEKAQKNSYSAIKMVTDFREILAMKDVDAVVIVTPDHWHAAIAVKALNAGKDVYCEKPLSITVAEGRAMVNATRKNKRVFQTGSMQRSWPEFRQTAELIRNGYIGDIKTIKVSIGGPPLPYTLPAEPVPANLNWELWLGPNDLTNFNHELAPPNITEGWANWRAYKGFGGGGMTDWGAHMFDIVQWALDKDDSGPVSIIPPDGKNAQFLTYQYNNGITVTHEDFGIKNAIRFIGSNGQIDIRRGKLETSPDAGLKDRVIQSSEKKVYFSDNHYKDFLKALKERTIPICDVETGHRTATMCNIGNIAYELNRPLIWDPVTEKFKDDGGANGLLSRRMKKKWRV